MMFLFPVYFLAATSMWFSHLGGLILQNPIAYEVNRAVEHGVLEVFGLAIASVMLSSITRGGFDVDDIPCLPGPVSEDDYAGHDEEVDVAPTDPFGVAFATWDDSASSTPATLGKGRRDAIEQKAARSGFQIGKALPPTALAHGLPNAAHRPTRAASPTKPVSTDGGSRNGMVNVHDVQQREADGCQTFDEIDDWDPIVRDADLLLKEIEKLDEQVSSRLDFTGAESAHKAQVLNKAPSPQGPPDVLGEDSAFNTTALSEDEAYPIAAGTTSFLFIIDDNNQSGYYIGGYAPASRKTSQTRSRADAGALVLWVPPELVSTPDEALPPAEPGAMVIWTARDLVSSPMYGTIVAPSWCCYRMPRVLNRNHSGGWVMNGAILAARHARRAASALHASQAIRIPAEESTQTLADTSVDPSHESVLETRPPWWEQESAAALFEALAPWFYVTARVLAACGWVWMSRYRETCKLVTALGWALVWFLATSPQVFDSLFTVEAWHAIVLVGKLSGSTVWLSMLFVANTCLRALLLAKISVINTWLAAVFVVKLAGSVGLAIIESDLVAAVLFLQAAAISIWILATHDAKLEAEQQQVNTSSTPSPVQSISPAPPAPPPPVQTEASPVPPTPPQTMPGPIHIHEAVATVPTVADRRARRKARILKRGERGIGLHVSAMRC